MTAEEFRDLSKYSYEELNSALQFTQVVGLAMGLPYTKADVLAEIARRSTPEQKEMVEPKGDE